MSFSLHTWKLTGASGSWELQAVSLFSTAGNSAIWVFPTSISYSPPQRKAMKHLKFDLLLHCLMTGISTTHGHVFMRANCSEGLHTWLLIPAPRERFPGEEHCSWGHVSDPGTPAVPLLQPSPAASAAPLQPQHPQGAQQSSTSGFGTKPQHLVFSTQVTPLPLFSAPLSLG